MRKLRIGLAQINTTVGDFSGNLEKMLRAVAEARSMGVDLITFPELAICGYPPEDLLFKPRFINENLKYLNRLVEGSSGITVIAGFIDSKEDIYNAAALIHDGKIAAVYRKMYLPNYGVFDEDRYFQAGSECPVYMLGGVGIGITICEDIWYEAGPATAQAYTGAEVIINISASPYHIGKGSFRERMIGTRAADNLTIIAFNNLVGGQDELVFDGNSLIFDEHGTTIARGKQFEEDMIIADLDIESVFRSRLHDPRWRKQTLLRSNEPQYQSRHFISEKFPDALKPPVSIPQSKSRVLPGEIYHALVLGTHDYVIKNGFQKVVIGLSGGIDSSIVATIAVDALGQDNVTGVAMPSQFTSESSKTDAQLLADNLGIKLLTIPIENVYKSYLDSLAEPFSGTNFNTTEENIQARIRGNFLMALSNKFGWLVLTTGNKSEYATGYTTLYGDMAGGFAVIKDVPKTLVYDIAKYRNTVAGKSLIPDSVLTKEPSAELRPNQRDADSLPPYPVLDPILTAYVEQDKSVEQIINMGFPEEIVKRSVRLVDISEYKRRQAPPGIKITERAFGRDRRLPLTSRFKGQ
ncbi:MAG TPA: NAD+ synthase [Dehalococcoidia bacterium]|nr:NAD+ synthase [Dehalococcoidia bacterium]